MAMNRLMGADLAGWLGTGGPPPASLANAAMWTPFALMFACGLGVRAALALPMDHRANWIFRLTEDEATRREQLRAVDRVVTAYVVGRAGRGGHSRLVAGVRADGRDCRRHRRPSSGSCSCTRVLLDWRRIPFTCSYLPGKRFVAHSLLFGLAAFVLFTLLAVELVRAATGAASRALMIAAVLSVAGVLLRRRRLAIWSATPLMFEDELPDPPQQLRL